MCMISILQIRIFARKNNECGSKGPISKKNIKVSNEVEYQVRIQIYNFY